MKRSPSELLSQCAKERLTAIYEQENKEFDYLLNKLDRSLDYSAYTDVKRCVTRLLRLTRSNRKMLIRTLKELF